MGKELNYTRTQAERLERLVKSGPPHKKGSGLYEKVEPAKEQLIGKIVGILQEYMKTK